MHINALKLENKTRKKPFSLRAELFEAGLVWDFNSD